MLENGILERDTVSMITRTRIVRFDLTSASKALGKNPPKLVRRAITRPNDIMNALLFSRPLKDMETTQRTSGI